MSSYFQNFGFKKKDRFDDSIEDNEAFAKDYGNYEKLDKKKNDLLMNAFQKVWQGKSQQLKDTIEENMDSGRSYKFFAIFLGIGVLFLFLSLLFLPTVIFSPHKFAMLFSLGSICMLVSMAFYRGPLTYTKRLMKKDQALFSIAYIFSLFLTLYASIIMGSYIVTILA